VHDAGFGRLETLMWLVRICLEGPLACHNAALENVEKGLSEAKRYRPCIPFQFAIGPLPRHVFEPDCHELEEQGPAPRLLTQLQLCYVLGGDSGLQCSLWHRFHHYLNWPR